MKDIFYYLDILLVTLIGIYIITITVDNPDFLNYFQTTVSIKDKTNKLITNYKNLIKDSNSQQRFRNLLHQIDRHIKRNEPTSILLIGDDEAHARLILNSLHTFTKKKVIEIDGLSIKRAATMQFYMRDILEKIPSVIFYCFNVENTDSFMSGVIHAAMSEKTYQMGTSLTSTRKAIFIVRASKLSNGENYPQALKSLCSNIEPESLNKCYYEIRENYFNLSFLDTVNQKNNPATLRSHIRRMQIVYPVFKEIATY